MPTVAAEVGAPPDVGPPDVGLAWCFKSPGGFNLTGADPANRAKLKKAFFSPGSRSPTRRLGHPVTPAFPASQS